MGKRRRKKNIECNRAYWDYMRSKQREFAILDNVTKVDDKLLVTTAEEEMLDE